MKFLIYLLATSTGYQIRSRRDLAGQNRLLNILEIYKFGRNNRMPTIRFPGIDSQMAEWIIGLDNHKASKTMLTAFNQTVMSSKKHHGTRFGRHRFFLHHHRKA